MENFGIESGLTRPAACPTIRVDEMMRGSSTTSHLFSRCEGVVKRESIRTTDALFFARYIKISRMGFRHSSSLRTAMKASVGSWTVPRVRIFFLPSFCFSNSFFFRLMSPP